MFDLSNLESLGDLAKQMEDTYSTGTDAMNQVSQQVAEYMNPDHQINIGITLNIEVEGHEYSWEPMDMICRSSDSEDLRAYKQYLIALSILHPFSRTQSTARLMEV